MSSSRGSIVSQTLHEITCTKLDELSKSRSDFENKKHDVLAQLDSEKDPAKRLSALSRGVKQCFAVKTDKSGNVVLNQTNHPELEMELTNLDSFLAQALYDPSISSRFFQTWESALLRHLEIQSLKFQYASLHAELVTEWLSSSGGESTGDSDATTNVSAGDDSIDNKKMESRAEWEKTVFEAADVDTEKLKEFLSVLFQDDDENIKTNRNALKKLSEEIAAFEVKLSTPSQFSRATLAWVIDGLLASKLLSDDKREVLKSFKNSPEILSEIADVLNMRIAALENWTWGASVAVEQRRNITGAYRIHMHEDLLQAIFLQYVGVKWSVFFKKALGRLRHSGGPWKSALADVPKIDKKRLRYYLGAVSTKQSVQYLRRRNYRQNYFLSRLLDSETQEVEIADGEEEAQRVCAEEAEESDEDMGFGLFDEYETPARFLRAGDDGDSEESEAETEFDVVLNKKPMEATQKLLRLLLTERSIGTKIHGEFTALRTTFEDWDALLPHTTVMVVLQFFGVSDKWLKFFTSFLEAPLKFVDEDDSQSPRIRRRGSPLSHALTDVFGEVVLFCLDLSVNQLTDGAILYRMYDDLWFWGPDHQLCVKTWKAIQQFADVTGTGIGLSKSGAVRISDKSDVFLPVDDCLPQREIGWGFLTLSPQTGRFQINESMVDRHIEELRKQLQSKRNSVFSFIQTWNTYAGTFFTSNFAKPAHCFGRDHVDMILATHSRVQREVFKAATALNPDGGCDTTSIVDYLRYSIKQRFDIQDIPDAYLFFPMELGGLDLQHSFIPCLGIRDSIEDPSKLLEKLQETERDWYNRAKVAFEKRETDASRRKSKTLSWEPADQHDRETFLSFEEAMRWREELSIGSHHPLFDLYQKLLEEPSQKSLEPDNGRVMNGLVALRRHQNLRGILSEWNLMDPYWKWIVRLYGPEAMDRFGGLNIVDSGLLPMGMLNMLRDKRVQWQA